MSKKTSTKKMINKAVQSTVSAVGVATTVEYELSYDEMLCELEAIISEANTRLAEEESTL